MDLYLVRHALAEDRNPLIWPDDDYRPLTSKGRSRFRKAARGLRTVLPAPDVVLSSPRVRAWDTALILEDVAGWSTPVELRELATGSPDEVIDALEPYAHARSVALVGHEPNLSRLAARLLVVDRPPFLDLKKGGVARLRVSFTDWESRATLLTLLQPRTLRALA
jgi:phosphohistidine phosphatase